MDELKLAAQAHVIETKRRHHAKLLGGLLAKLDPALSDALAACPTIEEVYGAFGALLDALPGHITVKWVRMGKPLLLAHYCGMRRTDLEPWEYAVAMAELEHGETDTPRFDGRQRMVRDPETGETWPSIKEAAAAIGCAKGTLHNYLNGSSGTHTVCGRRLEYGEQATSPYALDLSTPEKLEAYRAQCRAAGFEPSC